MKTIKSQIEKINKEGRTGLMTHVVAGCPNMKMCEQIVDKMLKKGVDFIEIQIPFSDPVADGPVMAGANEISLENGTKIKDVFDFAKKICKKSEVPILFMGYYNAIHKMGIEKFCKKAHDIGIAGLIFPDIPFDEAKNEGLTKVCKKYNLPMIQVISEITDNKRLKQIGKAGDGFIYCVSRFGTTGVGKGKEFSDHLGDFLQNVRKICKLPLAVGFGVSSKKDVQEIGKNAEVAVIGSAIMKIALDEKLKDKEKLDRIDAFLSKL